MAVDVDHAIIAAARLLGYESLRPRQTEAIKSFLSGRDVFVCLPTGSGKSLCYCLLPTASDILRGWEKQAIVVVVSPLVALMKDQVRAMAERSVKAVYVGDVKEDAEVAKICAGSYQLVFLSPEALLTDAIWRDMLQGAVYKERLVGVAIDEAHCVKKWYVMHCVL